MKKRYVLKMLYGVLVLFFYAVLVRCGGYTIVDAHNDNMGQFDEFHELVNDTTKNDSTNGGV